MDSRPVQKVICHSLSNFLEIFLFILSAATFFILQYVHPVSVLQIRNTFYFSFCLGTEKSRHLTYVFHIFLHVELITFSAFADFCQKQS